MDVVELTQHGAVTAVVAKAAVDLYRKSPLPSPSWALPTTALLGGIGGNFVINWYDKMSFDTRGVVFTVLVGAIGAATAVGLTELHDWVRSKDADKKDS